jgi:hypothetical protein
LHNVIPGVTHHALRNSPVMAGLVPPIHSLPLEGREDVDARHKAGHDGE